MSSARFVGSSSFASWLFPGFGLGRVSRMLRFGWFVVRGCLDVDVQVEAVSEFAQYWP